MLITGMLINGLKKQKKREDKPPVFYFNRLPIRITK